MNDIHLPDDNEYVPRPPFLFSPYPIHNVSPFLASRLTEFINSPFSVVKRLHVPSALETCNNPRPAVPSHRQSSQCNTQFTAVSFGIGSGNAYSLLPSARRCRTRDYCATR